jgi:hypothetical protein
MNALFSDERACVGAVLQACVSERMKPAMLPSAYAEACVDADLTHWEIGCVWLDFVIFLF